MQFTHPAAAPIILITGPVIPTDDPAVLFTGSPAGAGTLGPFDTSSYNSVAITGLPASGDVTVKLNWTTDNGHIYTETYVVRDASAGTNATDYLTNCKGNQLLIHHDVALSVLTAVASARTLPRTKFVTYTAGTPTSGTLIGNANDGYASWQGATVPHGGSGSALMLDIPMTNGPAWLQLANGLSHGPLAGAIVDAITGVAYAAISVPASAGASVGEALMLPARPVQLRLENTDGASDTTANLTLIYDTQ